MPKNAQKLSEGKNNICGFLFLEPGGWQKKNTSKLNLKPQYSHVYHRYTAAFLATLAPTKTSMAPK